MFRLLYSLIVTLIKTIYRIIYTLIQHLFSGAFEFFDTLSMTLIIQEIVLWIQIIIHSDYIIYSDGSDGNTRESLNEVVPKLELYSHTCSVNIITMFLALMQYFTFSSKLSMFYLVIKSASYDIIFYAIMLIILMFGYAVMGHVLFGISNASFKSLSETAMTNVLMIIGEFPTTDLQTLNDGLLLTFGMSFILLNMILLNMFIAIIGVHYFEFYIDMGNIEEINFVKIVIKIVLDKWYDKYKVTVPSSPVRKMTGESIAAIQQITDENQQLETNQELKNNDELNGKPPNKCRLRMRALGILLMDYANSKKKDEDDDFYESVDGFSHLEVNEVIKTFLQFFFRLMILKKSNSLTMLRKLSSQRRVKMIA